MLLFMIFSTGQAQEAKWIKYAGADMYDYTYGRRIVAHPNGSIYVLGQMYGSHSFDGEMVTTPFYRDLFLARYTTDGNLIWVKRIVQSAPTNYGDNRAIDIKVDSKGDMIIVGTSFSPSSFLGAPEGIGVYIAKMDEEANFKWIHYDPAISTADSDIGRSGSRLAIDADDNIFWYTDQNSEPSFSNYKGGLALVKYTPDGTRVWNKFITTNTTFYHPSLIDISLDKEGNFIVSGNFITQLLVNGYGYMTDNSINNTNRNQLFIAKISAEGDLIWAKQSNYGYSSSTIHAHTIDTNNNIYLSARIGSGCRFGLGSTAFVNNGPDKVFLFRLTPAGEVHWAEPIIGMNPRDVIQGKDGFIYFTGIYYNDMRYQSYNKYTEVSQTMVLKISTSGSFLGAFASEGIEDPNTPIGSSSFGLQSLVDNMGNIYTLGGFNEGIRFDCLPLTIPGHSFFLVKFDVANLPLLETTGPADIFCDYASITITTTPVQDAVEYQWYLPAGIIPVSGTSKTTENFIHVEMTPEADNQDVMVSIKRACGLYFSTPYKVRIKEKPAPPIFDHVENQVCPGNSKQFSVLPAPDEVPYAWSSSSGIVINSLPEGIEASLSFTDDFVSGTVQVTAKNFCGESTAEVSVVAFPDVTRPVLTGSAAVCTNFYNLEKSIEPIENAVSYEWSLPEFIIPNPLYPTNTTTLNAQIFPGFLSGDIRVRAIGICAPGEYSDPIRITSIPLPTPAVNLSGPTKSCVQDAVEFTVQEIQNAVQYEWSIPEIFTPNGIVYTQQNHISLTAIADGTDTLSVLGINVCGVKSAGMKLGIESFGPLVKPHIEKTFCDAKIIVSQANIPTWYINGIRSEFDGVQLIPRDSGAYYVQVENFCGIQKSETLTLYPVLLENLVIPNVVTPNGDGKNDTFLLDKSLHNSAIAIYNRWGKEIYSNEHFSNNWDPSALSTGTYYYTLVHQCLPKPYQGWIQVIK